MESFVNSNRSCFLFCRSWVKITAWRPAILADVFHGFPQYLKANARIVPNTKTRPVPSKFYLFMCGLLNDAVSSTDYGASVQILPNLLFIIILPPNTMLPELLSVIVSSTKKNTHNICKIVH